MPELYFVTDAASSKKLSAQSKAGKVRRLHHGIYTSNLKDSEGSIILKNWMQMVSYIVPNGILSFRTAIELKPLPFKAGQSVVFVTSSYSKTISLSGLIIKVHKGNYESYCEPILPQLQRSNTPRMLLENLTPVRGVNKDVKTIGEGGVENYLTKELRYRGEKALNEIRDQAKLMAVDLGLVFEAKKLYSIISALLNSHPDSDVLKTPYARALAKKEPFDACRMKFFENLSVYLNECTFKERKYQFQTTSFRNLAFFESYFSNFIEGTEFTIDEVEDIVFKGTEINSRHADSHDVLSNFNVANDFLEMCKTPKDPQALLEILKSRHAYIMKERPEKRPGEFKMKSNKAGNTYFVEPEDVIGTLTHAFEFYQILKEGIQRALFIHFVVSEIHPFDDGNGRLSRLMMNAELVAVDQYKIIIPIVHRDNYLNGLRRASRENDFSLYFKVMDQAQAYTESVPWQNYMEAREKIENDYADKTPDEGLPIFSRALRKLALSEF